MRMTITLVATLASMSLVPPATAQEPAGIPEQIEADAVRNYARIDDRLAVAGQPTMEALRGLKEMGFKTVVNLRTPGEFEEDEGAIAREAGLDYVSVPVSSASFSSADVDAVARVLDDETTAPVLVHCASSNRVGAVMAVLEARRGKSTEDALAFGKQAGLEHAALIEAATRLIESER